MSSNNSDIDSPKDILPERALTPSRSRPRLGPVGTAQDLHTEYKSALREWKKFHERHIDKIFLWSTLEQLIIQSRTTDGFSTEELYRALGVDKFHKERGRDWSGDEDLAIALDLKEEFLDLEAGRPVTVDDNEPIDNEFIAFGRQLVWRRSKVEGKAMRLIHFMKYGTKDPRIEVETPSGFDFSPKENNFYTDFIGYPFREQVIIVRELLEGLSQSHRGRVFLADLFEYQTRAIFDPFAFLSPRRVWRGRDESNTKIVLEGDDAVNFAKKIHISVFAKDQEQVNRFFVGAKDFRLNFEPHSQSGTFQPYSIGEYVTDVIHLLLPGLYQFYAIRAGDPTYERLVEHANKPAPNDVVEKFVASVTSLYATDEQIKDAIKGVDWPDLPNASPEWTPGRLIQFQTQGSWTTQDTQALSTLLVNGLDTFVDKLEIPSERIVTGQIRFIFSVTGAIGSISTLQDESATGVDQIRAMRTMIGTLLDTLQIIDRFRGDFDKLIKLTDTPNRRRAAQLGAKASDVAKRVAPALDVLDIFVNTYLMGESIEKGDAAGWGYGAAAFSGVLGLTATYYSATGVLVASVGFGVAAVYVGIIGIVMIAMLSDSEIADWMRNTYFGVGWNGLTSGDLMDPGGNTYGYRSIDPTFGLSEQSETDYARQVSQGYSLIRPLGLQTVRFGRGEYQGSDRFFGHIVIEPADVYETTNEIRILKEGFLFLRPLPIVERARFRPGPGPRIEFEFVPNPKSGHNLHRFSLADNFPSMINQGVGDGSWKSVLAMYEQNPLMNTIEQWSELNFRDSSLDLQVTMEEAETDHRENVVTKWEATMWDISGGVAADQIFGIPVSEFENWRLQHFVEILYLPPDVAQSMQRRKSISVRPERLPIVTRERKKIENTI